MGEGANCIAEGIKLKHYSLTQKNIEKLFYKIRLFIRVHYEKLFSMQFRWNILLSMLITISEKVIKVP